MGNNVIKEFQNTAYGENANGELTPIFQINASYGIFSDVLTVTDSGSSGTTTTVDNMYTCQTGTANDGLASILSFRQLKFRQGQGAGARLTGKFTIGTADSQQLAGLITAEDIFSFGFLGTAFGIIHAFDGEAESQELTVTVAAAGAETATVTIDGTAHVISLTLGTGTVQHTAFEIATELNAIPIPNYIITSNNDQVVAQALISGPAGAFAFSSTGAAVAAWLQITAGVSVTINFIPQASWNEDTRLDGDAQDILIPTNGNSYQIQGAMGFDGVGFYVKDSKSNALVLVHKIQYANQNITLITSNPTYRVGWLAINSGNTSNITVQGDSAAIYIEGRIERVAQPLSVEHNQLAIGLTPTNVVAFRNRSTFAGKVNRIEVFPNLFIAATEANKAAVFQLVLNPVFAGDEDWSYFDKATSITEIMTDALALIGGVPLGTVVVSAGTSLPIRFNVTREQVTAFGPTLSLALVSNITSGAPGDMFGSATFIEDR
jgi:hypothetical protein